MNAFRRIWTLLSQTVSAWIDDGGNRMAAAVSFYAVFSLGPLLIIAVAIAGFFLGQQAAGEQLLAQIRSHVDPQTTHWIQRILERSQFSAHGVVAIAIGVVVLLSVASRAFNVLQDSLNQIWGFRRFPGHAFKGLLRKRALSLAMVLFMGVMLLLLLSITTALAAAQVYLGRLGPPAARLVGVAQYLAAALISAIWFALIYKVLPYARVPWRFAWIGAAATAVLFTLGNAALAIYLVRYSPRSVYGAAGSLLVVMLWFYYSSTAFFLGAEFTKTYSQTHGQPS